MGKLLRVRDRIMLGLAIIGDVHNSLKTMDGILGSAYETAYGFVPRQYRKSNFYVNVSRMIKSDDIEKIIDKQGIATLRISSKGKDGLTRDFPLLNFQNQKWDGKWRIVTFDIPEKERSKRDRFRFKLKELGFGMVQKSLWVTPHPLEDDISEFINSNNLSKYSYVFVSGKLLVGNVASLINNIWKLDKINKLYEEFCNDVNIDIYFEAIVKDPFLPKELLPKDWWGDKAKSKLKTLQNK